MISYCYFYQSIIPADTVETDNYFEIDFYIAQVGTSEKNVNCLYTCAHPPILLLYIILCLFLFPVSHSFRCDIQAEKNPEDPQLLSLINLTATAVKRMIKMVKKINAFKNMCQEDQVALLKGSCTEMMILRSIMQYDVDHSAWKIPHSHGELSNIKSDVLKLASNNVYAIASFSSSLSIISVQFEEIAIKLMEFPFPFPCPFLFPF